MTNDDDTTAAPTTEVPPATQAAPELAWSVDTEEMDTDTAEPWPRMLGIAMVALVAMVGVAVIALGAVYFGQLTAKHVEHPTNPPTPTTTATAALPCTPATVAFETCTPEAPTTTVAPPVTVTSAPTTVTVTAAPPAPTSVPTTTPDLPAADANFLALLKDSTTGVTDPARAIAIGHTVCGDLTQTPSTRDYPRGVTVANTIAQLYGMDWNTADDYVEAASVAYCPDIPTTH